MSKKAEEEEEFKGWTDVTQVPTEELVDVVKYHRQHDRKDVREASDELDRRKAIDEASAVLEGGTGIIKGGYKWIFGVGILMLVAVLFGVSFLYGKPGNANYLSYGLLLVAMGLFYVVYKYSADYPMFTFTEDALIVHQLRGADQSISIESIQSFERLHLDSTVRLTIDGNTQDFSLKTLTTSNRTLFLNTLHLRLAPHTS